MLIAAHSIAGGALGVYLDNPFWAFLSGILLHFILDAIPHFDTTDKGKMTFRQIALIGGDAIAGLLIIFFIIKPELSISSPFLWGAFGGIFPDVLDNVPFWERCFRRTRFGKFFHKIHEKVQFMEAGPFYGIFVQVIVVVVSMFLALR